MRWIRWVWQDQLDQVLAELTARQSALGVPASDEPPDSPRHAVTRALTYLQNNRERMHYAAYRQQGLPITSSYVEAAVKQFNYRLKGTEEFWTEDGVEGMLQLRADLLSDDQPLQAFWKRREAGEAGQRRYRKTA